ncbi:SRPBCC family protein [Ruania zhangjianzhongii]|uniref:SRPBCC family protein n=1 Tax=Ruania zhangjianzhongii TaxID=2603206 RepID=UPI0011CC296E|nr:SRPBCC domain-containing protein [Ruania zhangjianzhongii]
MNEQDAHTNARGIDLEIEVPGTPEQVWEAIATGAGVSAWMHPTQIEEHAGGSYSFDMQLGAGSNDTGRVADYDRPHRFATDGVVWQPQGDAPPATLATEWFIEARDGGSCTVRMVMSGFGTGDVWDEEIDGMTAGMGQALQALRSYLQAAVR